MPGQHHTEPEPWIDLTQLAPRGGDPLSHAAAQDWSLALRAVELPHRVRRRGHGFAVLVPPSCAVQADAEIARFEAENPDGPAPPPPPPPPALHPAANPTLAALALLAGFHVLAGSPGALGRFPEEWQNLGGADAALILAGAWERCLTALTLHADAGHLLSNLLFGGIFFYALTREMRAGWAALAFTLSGGLGNAANALLHGPGHHSVGASTGVFGLVGALAGLRALRDDPAGRAAWRRVLIPLGAGASFLALLGAEGENTDLGAHALGFAAWALLGLAAGLWARRRGAPGPGASLGLGLAALALLAGAWLAAWSRA
jgi:rhomboid protease GluP